MSVISNKVSHSAMSRANTNLSGMNKLDPTQNMEEEQNSQSQPAVRNILGFIEKFDRIEQQELLAQMTSHWLLSHEDFKVPIDLPKGIISQLRQISEDHLLILIPYEEDIPALDYREIHQIVRELTIGMYVFNSHPNLHFETNYDHSTSCQMPPAYIDSKLGQVMISTDYWMKALWHGSFFEKSRRIQFVQKYLSHLDVDSNGNAQTKKSIFKEFLIAGLSDIAKDPEYSGIFKKGSESEVSSPFVGVGMNAEFPKSTITMIHEAFSEASNKTDSEIEDEIKNFLSFINDIAMVLTVGLTSVKRYKNMFEYEAAFDVNTSTKADHDRISDSKFERLKPIMNSHEGYIRENFTRKKEVRSNMTVLKFASFLIPTLIALKKRMKIPDLNNLLPIITGEEVKTERNLPPQMIGDGFKSKTFLNTCFDKRAIQMSARTTDSIENSENSNLLSNEYNRNPYFSLHGGIQFELETVDIQEVPEFDEEFEECYDEIINQSAETLINYLAYETTQQEYKVPVVQKNNKKYWAVRIDIESYYAQFPQKPYWVCKLNDDLSKLRPKRMPMSDLQVYDHYKKHFGFRKATKLKGLQTGLKAATQRGFSNVFQSFARKTQLSNLARQDEFGLGLIHYASIFNKSSIITNLVMLGIDSNLKQQISVKNYMQPIGPLPVHYAARCGALDALSCLLCNYANLTFFDENGWLPIHHAAYFDNVPAIRLLLRRQDELKEAQTKTETEKKHESARKKTDISKKTPLLVAASAGSLEAVKILIKHNVNINYRDEYGRTAIHMATLRIHINVLMYFIEKSNSVIQPWEIITSMLDSKSEKDKETAVKCLQLITAQKNDYWEPILNSGGIVKLVNMLREYAFSFMPAKKKPEIVTSETPLSEPPEVGSQQRYLNALSVLCNISFKIEVKQFLNQIKDLADVLIMILEYSKNEDMESRAAILIGDLTSFDIAFKDVLSDKGCLDFLIGLLQNDSEDVLVNAVNAIEIMCKDNVRNQNYCCEHGIFGYLLELLTLNSDFLKITVSAAISALTNNNFKSQNLALDVGLLPPLIDLLDLLKSRNMTVQLKVAMALESLAINNRRTQEAIVKLGADIYMIKLCEIKSNMEDWSIIVREQAAITLWTLAGTHKPQRKVIAEKIGIPQIISMLMSKSEKLQFVGCKCMIALVLEDVNYQNEILEENGIDPLIRLLRTDKTSNRVVLAIFETIAALCVDIAHVNNKLTQIELCEKGAIDIILQILNNPPAKYDHSFIQIETSHALACLILNRSTEPEIEEQINIKLILGLIKAQDLSLRLEAGLAITILAYNNNEKQFQIKNHGGVSYESYRPFFDDPNVELLNLCHACFQIIILARVINDKDQVWLTALGIERLVELLLIENDDGVVIQTASYMSSLAHTRTGIVDAMLTCDAVDILCDKLYSPNNQIKFASAVTLGYLTFNRTASRLLLHNCRNVPTLYNTLMNILKPENKISTQFVESYQTALELGLPKLLVKNKVKFFEPSKPMKESEFKGFYNRYKSAKEGRKPFETFDTNNENRLSKSASDMRVEKSTPKSSFPKKLNPMPKKMLEEKNEAN